MQLFHLSHKKRLFVLGLSTMLVTGFAAQEALGVFEKDREAVDAALKAIKEHASLSMDGLIAAQKATQLLRERLTAWSSEVKPASEASRKGAEVGVYEGQVRNAQGFFEAALEDVRFVGGLKLATLYLEQKEQPQGTFGSALGILRSFLPGQTKSIQACLLYTSPSPRDRQKSRMPSSA